MPSELIEFRGGQGALLSARIDTPASAPHAWAIFAHCFTCSKDSKAAAYISRALAQAGFGVMRFDFEGLGDSGGDFADTHFSSNVDDLIAACEWLHANRGPAALLIGHSLGGAAVLAGAARVAQCRVVATLGAPFDPAHVSGHFAKDLARIEADGRATVTLAGRPFTITQAFVDDLGAQSQVTRIGALGRPLLVMHAPDDRVVRMADAKAIFEAARHPKSFVSLDGADHLLDREADARFAAGVIAAWAARYVPQPTTGERT